MMWMKESEPPVGAVVSIAVGWVDEAATSSS